MAKTRVRLLLAWVVTSVLALGCAAAAAWAVPTWNEAQNLQRQATTPTLDMAPTPAPGTDDGAPVSPEDLGPALDEVLDSLDQGTVSAQVFDAHTGEVLYSREASASRVPASNMKLLVDYAVLATAPQARFSTSVRLTDTSTLALVAGGDTLLVPGESQPGEVMGHAGVETLAERTIAALAEQGKSGQAFTVNLDTTIFTGSDLNPDWAQEDIDSGFISSITPLAFYSHYSPGSDGAASTSRPKNAPKQVQQTLVDALNQLGADRGLTFTTGQQLTDPAGGSELARVESATAAEQSALMMQESDNSLAETLGRNLSVARGGAGSTDGAITAVRETLQAGGLPTDYTQVDISGLSMNNRVSNELLTALALRAVNGSAAERLALNGLPVAGYSGTLGLASRFNDADESAGRGVVRAKTGTLNSVLSLTGYTVTDSGRPLVFSVMLNNLEDADAAKNTIDRFAARLTDR
ncbi:D-alanyl-D-alanine carboxypeptidase/D-alanyl-D-alanine-endopeptidase [Rothia nasimurium]|uniref:D-alanyl-D-alanine carboxypeptidase/D-alanyl-D-alanine-endopeptidase n=1 Tax=Rothia nasimurium TaxID=85336 RepID=A0A1Y1RSN6_9MICC|nr:D-alanyl-D-alanine carboxypeptidase/D-alanyl-D-alanine-endopeptidase [Rothia nasimurium]ORC22807.1 D-alanyl-D-alanine carboxypeptidase/D-alanyl-D-alanine-endopeptidase [Rothia nasimurium]